VAHSLPDSADTLPDSKAELKAMLRARGYVRLNFFILSPTFMFCYNAAATEMTRRSLAYQSESLYS